MPFCGQCGAKTSENAKFCEQCGMRLRTGHTSNGTIEKNENVPDADTTMGKSGEDKNNEQPADNIEELDLTSLDEKVTKEQPGAGKTENAKLQKNDNIINLNEILESEKKVEMDDSIKREVLADDEVLSKICPMCGEEMQLNKQLMENAPVMVKCLKCGNETKIW